MIAKETNVEKKKTLGEKTSIRDVKEFFTPKNEEENAIEK